jgi:hypothetical protein
MTLDVMKMGAWKHMTREHTLFDGCTMGMWSPYTVLAVELSNEVRLA